MVKYAYELIVADKCSHCKRKSICCDGQMVLQGVKVVSCPLFLDKRSTAVITKDSEYMYPIASNTKERKKKTHE